MRDPGVPCQLEFFSDADLVTDPEREKVPAKGAQPPSTGRLSLPIILERIRHEVAPVQPAKPAETDSRYSEAALTAEAVGMVCRIGLGHIGGRISVRWNPRMRTAAGRAFYESLRIELNPSLLHLEGVDGEAEVDRTLKHELAHLVAFHRAAGRRIEPHGPEWQQACDDLGIGGEARCHTLPLESRRLAKKLIYECPACGSEIHRVRRFRRTVACYDCCRKHSGGRYDERFRLKARRAPGA
jgi:SprT protein